MRYTMLRTLRAYGLDRLTDAGEEQHAATALAGYALSVAMEATAGLATSDEEPGALHWLDAEDATFNQALDWALGNDLDTALRLAIALAPWWWLRGRYAEGHARLSAAAGGIPPPGPSGPGTQLWLGTLSVYFGDYADGCRPLHRGLRGRCGQPGVAGRGRSAGRAGP